jgi:hypothetical protein
MNGVAGCGRITSNGTVADGGRGVDAMNCATIVGRIACYCAVCDVRGRIPTQDPTSTVACYYTVFDGRRGVEALDCI